MKRNYKQVVDKLCNYYYGDIQEDELLTFFEEWAKNNCYARIRKIRLLADIEANSKGEELPIVMDLENDGVYCNDGWGRWTRFPITDRWVTWEYLEEGR